MKNVKGPIHGRYSTYVNWGCRCDECRGAKASYERTALKKRRAALARMGYNITSQRRSKRPEYSVSDLSRAVTVRKLLPKQSGVM